MSDKITTKPQFPAEVVNEAKRLCVKKHYGCLKIQRELSQKHPEFGTISQATIGKWIRDKGWRELREEVKKKTDEKLVEKIVDENLKEMSIIDEALDYIVADMRGKNVKSNISEIANLVKLRMLKRGETTENVATTQNEPFKIVVNYPNKPLVKVSE